MSAVIAIQSSLALLFAPMARVAKQAAIYCRISDDREGRELGVGRQEADCRKLAEDLSWTLGARPVFTDNDRGASTLSKKKRPAYEEMLGAVRAGQVDGVLYYSNSRLTRRPREYESIIDLVDQTGVLLASVKSTQVDLTTASGRMVGRVLAAVDAAEAEQISERVMRRQQQRREEGLPHVTGMRPFGYLADGITVDPEEAALIRKGAELVLQGASIGDVMRAWTEAGVLPPSGGRWSRTTVKAILTRPRAAGFIEHKGEIVGKIGGEDHVPILDEQTWHEVRAAVLQKPTLATNPNRIRFRGRQHLLGGFLVCGVCGSLMKIYGRRDKDGGVRRDSFAACMKEYGGCGSVKRNLRLLEAYVVARMEYHLSQAHGMSGEGDDEVAEERSALQAEREAIEARIAALREQYTGDDVEIEDYLFVVQGLRKKQRELTTALRDLDQAPVRDLGDDQLAVWKNGTLEGRRTILQAAVDRIVVKPIGKVGPARSRAVVPSTTKILWRTPG